MSPEESRVLDHYENPYHRYVHNKERIDFYPFQGGHVNETCGDHIRYWGCYNQTSQRRIIGLWWEGSGCCFSQAAASMLAEHCEAKRFYEVRAFTQDDMLALFGVDVEPGRIECVMVAYHALQKALENYDE